VNLSVEPCVAERGGGDRRRAALTSVEETSVERYRQVGT
jgi:hypothetical protein